MIYLNIESNPLTICVEMLSQFVDVEVDVDELNPEQVTEINKMATTYGMAEGDFVWFVHSFFNENSPLECIRTKSK